MLGMKEQLELITEMKTLFLLANAKYEFESTNSHPRVLRVMTFVLFYSFIFIIFLLHNNWTFLMKLRPPTSRGETFEIEKTKVLFASFG